MTIIGSPGAGKTTFAKRLAKKTGLPLIHLDFYHHDTTKNYLVSRKIVSLDAPRGTELQALRFLGEN